MKRLNLIELEDQIWFPASVRDAITDYLQFVFTFFHVYQRILPRLQRILNHDQVGRPGSVQGDVRNNVMGALDASWRAAPGVVAWVVDALQTDGMPDPAALTCR